MMAHYGNTHFHSCLSIIMGDPDVSKTLDLMLLYYYSFVRVAIIIEIAILAAASAQISIVRFRIWIPIFTDDSDGELHFIHFFFLYFGIPIFT